MRFLIILGFLLFPLAAAAQQVDTNTRAGEARIVEAGDGRKAVMIGNTRVALPEDAYLAFFKARLGDLLLVLYSPGGNACNGFYTWVHATPGAIRRSEGFGTCAEAKDISWDSETVRVTMASGEPGKGDVTFIYDGKRPIWTEQAALAASGVSTVAGWIGRYPFELVAAAEMQAPLRALMGASALLELQTFLALSGPMRRDGNWVSGTGCRKQSCDVTQAAIAINLSDGRLMAAIWQKGAAPRFWGNPGGAMPADITAVLAQR